MMKFLRWCQQIWLAFSVHGGKPVAYGEELRRFITNKKHISKKDNKPKPQAFLPGRDGCTSTYRVPLGKRAEARLWSLGHCIAAGSQSGVLAGQASILAFWIDDADLVIREGRLPSLHVDITEWPPKKDQQMLVAERLVRHASLIAE
jgi:hypothetical protein